jgi:hypothetical protein
MSSSQEENPFLPDDSPRRPDFETGVDPERPQELVNRLDQIEGQDLQGEGTQQSRPYSLQGEDEGPLGEGGQLREPDAGGGGGR